MTKRKKYGFYDLEYFDDHDQPHSFYDVSHQLLRPSNELGTGTESEAPEMSGDIDVSEENPTAPTDLPELRYDGDSLFTKVLLCDLGESSCVPFAL